MTGAELGDENIFGNLDDALDASREHLGLPPLPPPPGPRPAVAPEEGRKPEYDPTHP